MELASSAPSKTSELPDAGLKWNGKEQKNLLASKIPKASRSFQKEVDLYKKKTPTFRWLVAEMSPGPLGSGEKL